MALSNFSSNKLGSISFGVVNLNHSRSAISVLSQDIANKCLDIVCVTEPYYTDHGVTSLPIKYNVIAVKNRPRAAIVIANSMIKYNIICEKDHIIISASYNNDNMVIINIILHQQANL